jgi:hypothetical protein
MLISQEALPLGPLCQPVMRIFKMQGINNIHGNVIHQLCDGCTKAIINLFLNVNYFFLFYTVLKLWLSLRRKLK